MFGGAEEREDGGEKQVGAGWLADGARFDLAWCFYSTPDYMAAHAESLPLFNLL